ncbi:SGNH/GDSL hydrolase family protein [Lentzea flaviverrucosa]|uniref:Lysophospholipase L1 n=1 Tax=Lentzea flaviverrucosa TaxID=200379 RepID=A0A1H9MG38_9PSEU|nr:SGNH/GDSL hydrolase family protein [Lentzea flaviverrucosa]RDI30940.1 lysophospholipase L1-like esterase [Lentzea flaviverrucosa]SER22415.1 Lysophospholipase L1 [Lentzea flaviverrucosa]
MIGLRTLRAVAMTAATLGGLSGAVVGLLTEQGRRARAAIGVLEHLWPAPDGVYLDDGGDPVRLAVLGDSMAVGVGVTHPSQMPGVLLAEALAAEAGRPVRLSTYAISGSTTRDLVPQVDAAVRDVPEVALIIIGANDVTSRLGTAESARLLAEQVGRLRAVGCGVVVGTCPDLGIVRPIPQPLRMVRRRYSLRLAAAQTAAVRRAGGVPVPLGNLLAPEFTARHTDMFSSDRFHPSAIGYEAAAGVLLAPLCQVAGLWPGWVAPVVRLPSAAALAVRPSRVPAWLQKRHA